MQNTQTNGILELSGLSLIYSPFQSKNKYQDCLRSLGFEGNGYQWEIIFKEFINQNFVFVEDLIFDSEHGMFCVRSKDINVLLSISNGFNDLEFLPFLFKSINKNDLIRNDFKLNNIITHKEDLTTGNLEYKRAIYDLTNTNSLNTVFDFTLTDLNLKNDELFTDIIRLEKDNDFHDRSGYFENWLYFRDAKNWKRCKKTGLAITSKHRVFYGDITKDVILKTKTAKGRDHETPEHLILVQIDKDFKNVVIDVFKYFHTYKKALIELIIKEHQFYY